MAQSQSGDGLGRWLLGGLVVGGIVLGLLVAAYAIGYHRGKDHARVVAPKPAATTTTTTPQPAPTTTQAAPTTTSTASPAQLAARGKQLYTSDGCSACHSLSGSAGAGPTLKGLAGSSVALADGSTVTADAGYLARSITNPDAQVVKGYQPGVMSAAVASHDLSAKPADVQALVAFITAQR
ncbi:MAG TPA: cytochrome c [Gaiellaceae bacterium]|nr:cytochrome c [Gaiellaceae bacterium]